VCSSRYLFGGWTNRYNSERVAGSSFDGIRGETQIPSLGSVIRRLRSRVVLTCTVVTASMSKPIQRFEVDTAQSSHGNEDVGADGTPVAFGGRLPLGSILA
jgi:hypothetical protein